MAKEQIVQYVDDVDGTPLEDGLSVIGLPFRVSGVSYEIDVTNTNAARITAAQDRYQAAIDRAEAAMAKDLEKYAQAGRKVTNLPPKAKPGKGAKAHAANVKERSRAIRDWAATTGWDVAPRGRIRQEIVDAYDSAMMG